MGDTDCQSPSACTSAPHRDLCRPGRASSPAFQVPIIPMAQDILLRLKEPAHIS